MDVQKPTERLKQLLPQLFETDNVQGNRYLLFEIIPTIPAAISLDQIWEATRLVATSVTPIPLMAPYVLGWSTGRDRVYCVIDFAKFLRLDTSSKVSRQYSVIVVQASKPSLDKSNFFLLGLSVNRIIHTVTCMEEIISPEAEPSASLIPYLKGCLPLGSEKIPLLDMGMLIAQMTPK